MSAKFIVDFIWILETFSVHFSMLEEYTNNHVLTIEEQNSSLEPLFF